MIRLIGHRGPDELCLYSDPYAALAVARLSIIDIAAGRQPMSDPSGRYWIAYNGEIYNYRELRSSLEQRGHQFRTGSDTEVVLRSWIEWGRESPRLFDGGFAFVIYDRELRSCTFVRDRFGKRPLYYLRHEGAWWFASEMKAFLACPGFRFEWDADQLASIFGTWTPIGDQSGFAEIKQVPSGSILTITQEKCSLGTYAGLPAPGVSSDMDLATAIRQVRERLDASVRMRLRSDVEVAVLVSGGLDSAIVTRLANEQLGNKLRTYSISFTNPDFDERDDQKLVTDWFGLAHRTIEVDAGDIERAFPDAMWHAEVPQFRTAFVPMYLLAQRISADGIKVVLSGEGADEAFLGYDIFKETALRAAWQRMSPECRRARLRSLYPYLRHFTEDNISSLSALLGRTSNDGDDLLFSHRIRFENSGLALRLLPAAKPFQALRDAAAAASFAERSPVRRAQWLEFSTLLQGYLLSTQSDRMLFAHGVEPRCPFLAPAVVELAASLPEAFLLSPEFDEKRILKQAFQNELPPEVLAKPKWPYRAPDASSFLRNPKKGSGVVEWVADALAAEAIEKVAPLNAGLAKRLVDRIASLSPDAVSPSENQAFVFLLSLVVLDRLFVRGEGRQRLSSDSRPVIQVSQDTASSHCN